MFISSIFGIAIENTDLVLCTSDILRPWYIGEKSWKHRSLFSTKHPRISYPSTVYPEMFSIFTQALEYFSLLLVQFFSPPFYSLLMFFRTNFESNIVSMLGTYLDSVQCLRDCNSSIFNKEKYASRFPFIVVLHNHSPIYETIMNLFRLFLLLEIRLSLSRSIIVRYIKSWENGINECDTRGECWKSLNGLRLSRSF